MPDLSQYHLSGTFNGAVGYPKVDEIVCGKLVLAAWVNKNNALKGYRLRCGTCGNISEYVDASNLKRGTSSTCGLCYRNEIKESKETKELSKLWFYETYGTVNGEKLRRIYSKRKQHSTSPIFPDGIPFYDPWKIDYKGFAEYIVLLHNFNMWPEYDLDRIDTRRGYMPGNLHFVSHQDNTNNTIRTRYIKFNKVIYSLPNFIRLICGQNTGYVYSFIKTRISNENIDINPVLKHLYCHEVARIQDVESRDHFINWYDTNITNEDTAHDNAQ